MVDRAEMEWLLTSPMLEARAREVVRRIVDDGESLTPRYIAGELGLLPMEWFWRWIATDMARETGLRDLISEAGQDDA